MLQQIRWMRAQYNIPLSRVYNFDEIRLNSSDQDLNQRTLEFASVKDPIVKKIANPKEAFTGILFGNADGSELMVFLVTKKGLPVGSVKPEMIAVYCVSMQKIKEHCLKNNGRA